MASPKDLKFKIIFQCCAVGDDEVYLAITSSHAIECFNCGRIWKAEVVIKEAQKNAQNILPCKSS